MECPICHEDVVPVQIETGAWKKKYKCPNYNSRFSKRTLLNKAARFTANVALLGLLGDVAGGIESDT